MSVSKQKSPYSLILFPVLSGLIRTTRAHFRQVITPTIPIPHPNQLLGLIYIETQKPSQQIMVFNIRSLDNVNQILCLLIFSLIPFLGLSFLSLYPQFPDLNFPFPIYHSIPIKVSPDFQVRPDGIIHINLSIKVVIPLRQCLKSISRTTAVL